MAQSRQNQLPGARRKPATGPKRVPGNDNRKKPPFKKRIIRPGDPLFRKPEPKALPFGKGIKKKRPFPLPRLPYGKFMPWVGGAVTAWTFYQALQNERMDLTKYGYRLRCSVPMPPAVYAFHYGPVYGHGIPPVCGVPSQPYDWGSATPVEDFVVQGNPALPYLNEYLSDGIIFWAPDLATDRGTMVENWHRYLDEGHPARDPVPLYQPRAIPYAVPPSPEFWPDPFSPYNVPLPAIDPIPASPPWPRLPVVYPPGRHVPSIDLTPDGVKIGWHEKRPPRRNEREKKKRLGSKNAAAWVSKLQGWIGGFTESDDFMSALYKGLHWKVRRWRGRDGVWRDRDITSFTRAKRLGSQIGDLSIEKAITEIVKENATDWAYGKTSKKIIDNFKESGLQFPHGLTSRRYGGSWEEVYEMLRKQQGAKINPVRYIYKNEYDPVTRTWQRTKTLRNDRTTIPWYRQKSDFKRRAYRGESEYWELPDNRKSEKVVERYFYAPSKAYGPNVPIRRK